MKPEANGFSFPNFPSSAYPIQFDEKDLVGMFGSNETVCVDAVADPCVPTAEAAAFARMVNQARATGHCEGLVTVALSRFDAKEQPSTVALPAEGETLDTIMRAFATQFIPEAQKDAEKWAGKSLKDKIAALAESFSANELRYTLGVYVEQGGHALLPYAVEFPQKDLARIKVYDSNWPAKDRWVDVDLKSGQWRFAFSGSDPANDPAAWTGGSGNLDLTGVESRAGSCPFCGDGTKVLKNTLLLRTDNLDWSVDVNGKTVTPKTPDAAAEDGVTVKPVKGADDRNAYDYVIQVPVQTTSAGRAAPTTSVKFTGAASMFALTPGGISQVETPGTSGLPVEIGNNSVGSKDPAVNLTLASGNLVASATGGQSSLEVKGETLAVTVQTSNGQVVEQQVTPQAPAAKVVADTASGAVTVLSQSVSGSVVKREVSSDGTETKSTTADTTLNLSTTAYQAPRGLESKAVESLPEIKNRDLSNADYRAEVGKAAESVVVAQKATVGTFTITDRSVDDAPFTVEPPSSDSPGAFTFTSSNEAVATVTAGGKVTPVSSGSVFIHAAQAGTDRYLPSVTTATLRILRAKPTVSTASSVSKKFGDADFALPPLLSSNPAPFTWESTDTKVVKVLSATGKVSITGAGTATLVATQAATEKYESVERRVSVNVARRSTVFAAAENINKTYGDADFTLSPPASPSSGSWTYTSSNADVLTVNSTTGSASIKGAGEVTVTMTQAATTNDESANASVIVSVAKAKPVIGALSLPAKTWGSGSMSFTATAPTSTSSSAFSWASSDQAVATVNQSTGAVVILRSGSTTITASQAAGANHEKGSVSAVLTVAKAAQAALSISGQGGVQTVRFVPTVSGGSGAGAVSFSVTAAGTAGCVSKGSYVLASGAGTCSITATKAGDSDHEPVTSQPLTASFQALTSTVQVTEYSFYNEWVASNYTQYVPDLSVQRTAVGTTYMNEIYAEWIYSPDPFGLWDFFIVRFDGYVTSPTTGNVRFRVGWDDGVKLILDGTTVAENWAISCCDVADSADIAFTAGEAREFRMWYFDAEYNSAVKMEWSFDGGQTWANVPASALSHRP